MEDRRLILVGGAVHDDAAYEEEEEEEEEFVFEEDDEAMQAKAQWMAIARFYSGQEFKTWVLFNELSKAWGGALPMPVRDLRDNRFLVEFDSEWLWKKAIFGGPWTFRGDAVIFVAYDGLKRFSEIIIDSISLWIRIYDIPVAMMTEGFVRTLGAKFGKVLEVGEARMDYKRVKVDFPLTKALVPVVKRRVQGFGLLSFAVRYENITHFCFSCGRIGHVERECPEEAEEGGVKFGKALRCLPQKRDVCRQITIPAGEQRAHKGLNFSGAQKEKVMAAAQSSTGQSGGWRGAAGYGGEMATGAKDRKEADAAEVTEKVASMSMGSKAADARAPGKEKSRVSGLNSFVDSSESSACQTSGAGGLSMHERLMLANQTKRRDASQKGGASAQ